MISRYLLILIFFLFSLSGVIYSSIAWHELSQENPEPSENQEAKKPPIVVPPSALRRSNTSPPEIIHRTPRDTSSPVAVAGKEPILLEGSVIEIRLAELVSSRNHQSGDQFEAILDRELTLLNNTRIPKGTRVKGRVLESIKPGRVKGKAEMRIVLDSIQIAETEYTLRTNEISFEAESTKGEDAKAVGISTAIGAAVGAIFGGKKGAGVGAASGAGAGTAGVLLSRGRDVELEKERLLSFRLEEDVEIVPPGVPGIPETGYRRAVIGP